MTEIRKKIRERIVALRNEKGITQNQLSELSGVSRRTIQGIEAGEFSARIDILDKILMAMGYTIEIDTYVGDIDVEHIDQVLKKIKDNTKNKRE